MDCVAERVQGVYTVAVERLYGAPRKGEMSGLGDGAAHLVGENEEEMILFDDGEFGDALELEDGAQNWGMSGWGVCVNVGEKWNVQSGSCVSTTDMPSEDPMATNARSFAKTGAEQRMHADAFCVEMLTEWHRACYWTVARDMGAQRGVVQPANFKDLVGVILCVFCWEQGGSGPTSRNADGSM